MDIRLAKLDSAETTLKNFKVSRWCIELDEQNPPRLYADDIFCDIMGMDKDLSPEAMFSMWEQQVPDYEKPRTEAYLRRIAAGESCKIEYLWMHPQKGVLCIRCSGMLDKSYTQGLRLYGMHQDTTDVPKVEQDDILRLQKIVSEAVKNKSTQKNGGLAIVRLEKNGTWVPAFISSGFADLCGMDVEQMRALYKYDAMAGVHPEDRLRLSQELHHFVNQHTEYGEFVYRLVRADGSYFWVRNSINCIRREDGFTYNYCSVHDIVQELEEQEELRQQFRNILNSYYLSLGTTDLLVAHCNVTRNCLLDTENDQKRDLIALVGTNSDNFMKFLSQFIVDEGERQEFLELSMQKSLLASFAAGKTELQATYFVKSPLEKHGRYALFKITLLQDPDSKDVMGVLFLTDATQKTIQQKIIDKMFALGTDRVVDLDLLHDKGTLLYAEEVHKTLIGRSFSFEKYVRRAALYHVLPADKEQWLRLLDKDYMLEQLRKKGSYSFTYQAAKNAHTGPRVKKLVVAPIDLRLGRICVTRMDVTDLVVKERRSKQAVEQALAAAECANRAKSEFLSNMSHDIRTPMNAILGLTEIALDKLDDRTELENCLNKISISGKHLLGLINNVLDMSKIEAGKMIISRELVSLPELTENLVTTVQQQAIAKGQQLSVHTEGLSCLAVYSDSLRLSQVLLNILGNAVKYTQEGGHITFTVTEAPSAKGSDYVRLAFSIKDNGIGMSQNFVKHIFESFSREDKLRVQKTEGSGLGMAITKYIVDAMGGQIKVNSVPNDGTEFVVLLDVERGELTARQKQALPEKRSVGKLRILLAEDNALNREIAHALLSKQGVELEETENGQLCVEAFSNSPLGYYDAVLMDVRMPVMNGYEATQAIRRLKRADANLPIIAMTADAFAEDVERCRQAGMNEHLSKPIDVVKLMDLLSKLCQK